MKDFALGPDEHADLLFAKVLKEIKASGGPAAVFSPGRGASTTKGSWTNSTVRKWHGLNFRNFYVSKK